jgi:hypothetical protein
MASQSTGPHNFKPLPEEIYKVLQHGDEKSTPMDDNARQYFGYDYPASPYVVRRYVKGERIDAGELIGLYPGSADFNKRGEDTQYGLFKERITTIEWLNTKLDSTKQMQDNADNPCTIIFNDTHTLQAVVYKLTPR